MTIKKVTVPLGEDSYDILIGSGILSQNALIQSLLSDASITTKQIAIVTNSDIAQHYLLPLCSSLQHDREDITIEVIEIPQGEPNKNLSTMSMIHDRLVEKKFSRDCLLLALGGGIVGDITGFAAATYQRGVDFIQVPTTLLAQVDSSVGGKTGVNHRLGKNLIGAFYQPKMVLIDTDVLKTLPPREMSAGMAEVIKYGLIRDVKFLNYLGSHLESVMALDDTVLGEVIRISCQHKADVVEADEKERGERATLNLGHTFGHAIEALTDYNVYLHGEAVAIGTMMAAELSLSQGWLSAQELSLVEQLFVRAHCPVDLSRCKSSLSKEAIRQAMQRDKKVIAGKLKLILLNSLGNAVICNDIDEMAILCAIQARL